MKLKFQLCSIDSKTEENKTDRQKDSAKEEKETSVEVLSNPQSVLDAGNFDESAGLSWPIEGDVILNYDSAEFKEWLSIDRNKIEFVKRLYKVVKFSSKDCFFIPNNYAKEICLPKDLTKKDMEELNEKYKDKKIPKKEQNYIEFGSYSNCSPFEKNEKFIRSMSMGKKYKGDKPRKIQDYCVKIKTDWLGNIIEFNGMKL